MQIEPWILLSSWHGLLDSSPLTVADWASVFFFRMSTGPTLPGKKMLFGFPWCCVATHSTRGWKASTCLRTTLTIDINHNQSALPAIIASLTGFEVPFGSLVDRTWWLTDVPADCLSGIPKFGWIMECVGNICALTEKSLRNSSTCPVWFCMWHSATYCVMKVSLRGFDL